jgi:hypothetical protein
MNYLSDNQRAKNLLKHTGTLPLDIKTVDTGDYAKPITEEELEKVLDNCCKVKDTFVTYPMLHHTALGVAEFDKACQAYAKKQGYPNYIAGIDPYSTECGPSQALVTEVVIGKNGKRTLRYRK